MKLKKILLFGVLIFAMPLFTSCGIYSFNSTAISSDIKTVSIYTIENRAMKVNPSLSNQITEAIQDKFRKLTKLEAVDEGGDLEISGFITSYDITPTAVTSDEVAAQNRLTITVNISFVNKMEEDKSFESKSFAAFQDYDSNLTFESVEAQLVDQIVETLVEDIFNSTVASW